MTWETQLRHKLYLLINTQLLQETVNATWCHVTDQCEDITYNKSEEIITGA